MEIRLDLKKKTKKTNMEEDYYEILGVPRTASPDEIKKAFKIKARQMHPDKGGDPEMFKKLNEAYGVLSNEDQKANYDRFGKTGINMEFPFPDFFQMFGGVGGVSRSKDRKTADRILPLELTLEEVYAGTTVRFCHKRKVYIGDLVQCSTCKGKGNVVERMTTQMGLFQNIKVCPKCTGIGTDVQESKFRTKTEISEVVVLPHAVFGSHIILEEKADEIPGMKTGNIILKLTPKKHKTFELIHRYHLLLSLEIHPLEAITMFYRDFVLPSGEKIVIGFEGKSPFLSTLNKCRRIRKKGMFMENGDHGDLFIKFKLNDYNHPNPVLLYHSARIPLPHFEPDNIPIHAIDTIDELPEETPVFSDNASGKSGPHVQECRPS